MPTMTIASLTPYARHEWQVSAIVAGVSTNLYSYTLLGQLTNETVSLCAETISRSYDTFGRPSGFALGDDYSVAYDYDMFGRFQSASSAQSAVSYTYSYLPNSDLLSGMTTAFGFRWIRAYESGRSRITSVENRFGETVISRYDYVHTVTECLGAS